MKCSRPSRYDDQAPAPSMDIEAARKRITILDWRKARLLKNLVRLVRDAERDDQRGWRRERVREAVIEEHRQLVTWHAMEVVRELNAIRSAAGEHLGRGEEEKTSRVLPEA